MDKHGNLSMVVFNLHKKSFAVNVHVAREIIPFADISPMPQAPDYIEGVINIRGHVVAVMDPKKRFGLLELERDEKARIMIVRASKMIVGLIIDEVFGVQKFSKDVVQSTPAIVSAQVPQRYISGIVQWNDQIVFLLNLDEVFSSNHVKALKPMA